MWNRNMEDYVRWVLGNFSLSMFILAIIFIFFHWIIRRRYTGGSEITFRWMALFALGVTGVFAFVFHAFYPNTAAQSIGWQASPFQVEVALAYLTLGILGILSFNASYGFRLATVIASFIILWGAAIGYFYQMAANQNYNFGSTESWLWMNIVIPLVLLFCILRLKPTHYQT